ncbi:tyrosine-type recombinase/integrase [uncultured Cellulomonas sp.]|uniref:tyrosine-type recombinase/integrase n=1 Tax=uncultured Cellulomonas sp. TaxID=189682 RepID=UPI0028E2D25C|nr:tyrosine-type recombinase/integrase [uncultured Cellulomonas sp.]
MTTNRNGFGSITRLPSKRYRARYTVPGTFPQVWASAPETFTRKVDAEVWLARQRTALEDGVVRPKAIATRLTLREYAETWVQDRRNGSGEPLRGSTRRVYEHYLTQHVYPALGTKRLAELTGETIASWYRQLLPDRPTLRARTYALLRGILATAVQDDLIAENPCRIRGAGRSKPAAKKHVASPAQIAELVAAMPDRLALSVLLGAWCQLRNGEVLELRRKDITPKVVLVTRGLTWVDGQPIVGPPKTDAGIRGISVPPHIAAAVAHHLDAHTAREADALLFPGRSEGTQQMHSSTYAYYFKQAVRKTTVPADFRFHWLRHTGLTLAAQSGATLAELQARAGHSTPSTVMLYQHATTVRDQALAAALSELAQQ